MSQMICREVVKCLRQPQKCCLCYFEYDNDKLCVVRLEDLAAVLLNTGGSRSSVAEHESSGI